jgi:hypothetical protein
MRFACLFAIAACGGGSDDPASDAPADAFDTAGCLIAGNYGDLGSKTGTTTLGPSTVTIVLDAGPPRDSFFLKLVTGKGAFAGGLATGTFALSGADLDFNNCGLCVNLLADIGNMGPAKFYFATAGSVTLTSTTPPVGTLSGVTLHEVTSGGQPILGGCTASIDAMAFSAQ